MAKKEFAKFVRPDGAAREAEAAKTTRLRALRLAREAEIAEEKKAVADREAAAKLAKAEPISQRVDEAHAHKRGVGAQSAGQWRAHGIMRGRRRGSVRAG